MEPSTRAQPPCPEPWVLEVVAAGGGGAEAEAARRHLAACPTCRSAVANIRDNNEFLAGILAQSGADGTRYGLAPDLVPTDLVPGYQILNEIHSGGQGVVYEAIQIETKRRVAIKLLLRGRNAGERQRIRFEQEIALAASLRHPNIVAVHDAVRPREGWLGYAMEYVTGRPLDEWTRKPGAKGAPTLEAKVRLLIKVCDAVQFAHRRGIIHRDLKPGNILVDADGEPRLCDFGVAKISSPEGPRTVTGEFVGTLAYASPEQVSGSPDEIDTRSDVYSLGVVIYEALTGTMPYDVDGPVSQVLRNITTAAPRLPAAPGVRIGLDLQTIILKALAKEPERRYQSVQRLGDDLRRSLTGEAIEARRSSGWYVLRKAARRHRVPVLVASGVFSLVAASAIISRIQATELRVSLSRSNLERAKSLVQVGDIAQAEGLLWRELLEDPAGLERWKPGVSELPVSRAWWALWQVYAAHPCARTVRRGSPLQMSPVAGNGGQVLVTDDAGSITIYSLPDLSPVAVLPAAGGPARPLPSLLAVSVSRPDGEIVGVRADKTIRRYRRLVDSLQQIGEPITLPGVTLGNGAALAPDGRLLAARVKDGMALINTPNGEVVRVLADSENASYPVFSPDGRWIACTTQSAIEVRSVADGVLRLRTPEPGVLISGPPAKAFDPAKPSGEPTLYLATDGTVFALDDRGMQPLGVVESASRLWGLSVSPDGERCAVCAEDRRVSIWATHPDTQGQPESRALAYLTGHAAEVGGTLFTPDGRSLLSFDRAGTIKRWDVPRPGEHPMIRPLIGHTASVFAIAMASNDENGRNGGAPRSTLVYTASEDETVRAWEVWTPGEAMTDPGTSEARYCSPPLGGIVDSVAVSPDGQSVAATVRIRENGKTVRSDIVLLTAALEPTGRRIDGAHAGRCADLAFSPDGKALVSTGDDGVKTWDAGSAQSIRSIRVQNPLKPAGMFAGLRSVRFSPDGRLLTWVGESGLTQVSPANLGAPARSFGGSTGTLRCVRFSPDGQRLAAAGDDFTVRLWDAASGRLLVAMEGHLGRTYGLGFSRGGRLLASCGGDGTVRLWDAARGTNLAVLRDDASYAHLNDRDVTRQYFAVAFLPDGKGLIVAAHRGYLAVWDLCAFERHIAGNAGYWIDRLREEGRKSPVARDARRWAEGYGGALEKR